MSLTHDAEDPLRAGLAEPGPGGLKEARVVHLAKLILSKVPLSTDRDTAAIKETEIQCSERNRPSPPFR